MNHREHFPTHDRSYWKDHRTAADRETANVLQIEKRWGQGYTTCLTFDWPKDQEKVRQLEKLLDLAYEAGKEAARREIRVALGVR